MPAANTASIHRPPTGENQHARMRTSEMRMRAIVRPPSTFIVHADIDKRARSRSGHKPHLSSLPTSSSPLFVQLQRTLVAPLNLSITAQLHSLPIFIFLPLCFAPPHLIPQWRVQPSPHLRKPTPTPTPYSYSPNAYPHPTNAPRPVHNNAPQPPLPPPIPHPVQPQGPAQIQPAAAQPPPALLCAQEGAAYASVAARAGSPPPSVQSSAVRARPRPRSAAATLPGVAARTEGGRLAPPAARALCWARESA